MATSLTFFKLLSSAAAAATLTAVKSPPFAPKSLSHSLPHTLKLLHRHRENSSSKQLSFSTKAMPISAVISVGDKLPDATLSYFDSNGELHTTSISDLTSNKKAIIFAIPGSFTPNCCSQKHLPGFVEKSAKLKSKGIDTIAYIFVNDAFVLRTWKKNLGINNEVVLLSNVNGDFTKAIGCELDLSNKPVGLGVRSRRYMLLAENSIESQNWHTMKS